VGNLETQSANIEAMVANSFLTADNVGGGNTQLKKAAERPSAAMWTFRATAGLCAFLIIWDLLI
jgi:syntaxin 18